ncbi:hypothetical protein NDU88_007239 [Pleurodeles waltl]|uniref:Uncharacterized protein n=1 Tax=Pleurodeles waltl TaxID=8319 RepID=A0AAV7P0A7_PLEWA|nr:hypothetical protein NDU88_007239 [Pleurodeles waltl]
MALRPARRGRPRLVSRNVELYDQDTWTLRRTTAGVRSPSTVASTDLEPRSWERTRLSGRGTEASGWDTGTPWRSAAGAGAGRSVAEAPVYQSWRDKT